MILYRGFRIYVRTYIVGGDKGSTDDTEKTGRAAEENEEPFEKSKKA